MPSVGFDEKQRDGQYVGGLVGRFSHAHAVAWAPSLWCRLEFPNGTTVGVPIAGMRGKGDARGVALKTEHSSMIAISARRSPRTRCEREDARRPCGACADKCPRWGSPVAQRCPRGQLCSAAFGQNIDGESRSSVFANSPRSTRSSIFREFPAVKHRGQISPGYHYYLRANMEAPNPPHFPTPPTPMPSARCRVALDKAQDLFAQGKAKLDKVRHLDIHDASAASLFERPVTFQRADPTADAPLASNSQYVRFGGNPTMNIELRKVRPNPRVSDARGRGDQMPRPMSSSPVARLGKMLAREESETREKSG